MFKKVAVGIIALMGVFAIFGSFFIVETGERALVLEMGQLVERVYGPGVHMKIPFIQSEEEYSILPKELQYNIKVDSNGAITQDNQTIGAVIKAYYKYDESKLLEMRQKYGEYKLQTIVGQVVYESFKDIVGGYVIFDIPAKKEELRKKVTDLITTKLLKYPVNLIEFKITNYDRSEDFDKQIEFTMKKAQEVKQKQQEVLVAEQEAQKQVKVAEAQKQAIILKAEGTKEKARLEAEAKELEGLGIMKYNESIAKTLKQELEFRKLEIELIKAERRNGVEVPNNMYGPIPIDTIGGLKGK